MASGTVKTGAVIVAAGLSARMKDFKPMLPIGGETLIRRIINTFKSAGVWPVVVVTGHQGDILEAHVADLGVECIRNYDYAASQMLDSAKLGLRYIHDKCSQILFTPSDIPLFSVDTVNTLMSANAVLAVPVHHNEEGHPLLMSASLVEFILADTGSGGLQGCIKRCGIPVQHIAVKDAGVLLDADTPEEYQKLLTLQKNAGPSPPLSLSIKIQLSGKEEFFAPGVATFLSLVDQIGSMRLACRIMNMSYTKAWKIVVKMENELGYPVLQRRSGGAGGGGSKLTPEGRVFVDRFLEFQQQIEVAAGNLFKKYYGG